MTSVYSPGSPIFLPNGARIFNRLVDFLRRQYVSYGFEEVITPNIYKKSLWEVSGHLQNYADDISRLAEGEDDDSAQKPMNCPGHCLIFASKARSYRALPIRYADFSPLHRNEVSGALSGLTRVRRFHQDDGHVFCRPVQIQPEVFRTLAFMKSVYGALGLGDGYAGPFWLNPRQAAILTLNDTDPVVDWAAQVQRTLLGVEDEGGADAGLSQPHPTGFTVDVDVSTRPLGEKLAEARAKAYGMILVVGKQNVEQGTVTLNSRDAATRSREDLTPTDLLRRMKQLVDKYQ
ncbi:Putative cutinase 1 [Verticillium dahliae VDG2]|nr:Putative cutinase 1 [Verticillium dahliae VDG2]